MRNRRWQAPAGAACGVNWQGRPSPQSRFEDCVNILSSSAANQAVSLQRSTFGRRVFETEVDGAAAVHLLDGALPVRRLNLAVSAGSRWSGPKRTALLNSAAVLRAVAFIVLTYPMHTAYCQSYAPSVMSVLPIPAAFRTSPRASRSCEQRGDKAVRLAGTRRQHAPRAEPEPQRQSRPRADVINARPAPNSPPPIICRPNAVVYGQPGLACR